MCIRDSSAVDTDRRQRIDVAAESMVESKRTADSEERSTAAASNPSACLERLCKKNSSLAGKGVSSRRKTWGCSCGHDFGDGSAVDAPAAQEHDLSKEHQE